MVRLGLLENVVVVDWILILLSFTLYPETSLTSTPACTHCWTPPSSTLVTCRGSSTSWMYSSAPREADGSRAVCAPTHTISTPSPFPPSSPSRHLPLYLVAAFVKKLSRLALTAPPHGTLPSYILAQVSLIVLLHGGAEA